jgi:hypothetical protein
MCLKQTLTLIEIKRVWVELRKGEAKQWNERKGSQKKKRRKQRKQLPKQCQCLLQTPLYK